MQQPNDRSEPKRRATYSCLSIARRHATLFRRLVAAAALKRAAA